MGLGALLFGMTACGDGGASVPPPTPAGGTFGDLGEYDFLGDPGGQTGDGTGLSQPTSGSSFCRGTEGEPVDDVNQAIDGVGFAPSDLLSWASATVESSVTWDPAGTAAMASPPAADGLRLSVTYQGGGARFIDGATVAPGETALPCPSYVELDVMAELTTADGALAERFGAVLRAARPGVVELAGAFERASLRGSLTFEPHFTADPEDGWKNLADFKTLLVQAVFTPHGSYGRLSAHTQHVLLLHSAGRPVQAPIVQVAVWPGDVGCAPAPGPWDLTSNMPIDGETEVHGQRADTWRARFEGLPPLRLQWPGQPTTTLSAQVEATSPVCYWVDWLAGTETLSYGVRTTATTADRSLVGEHTGFARVRRSQPGPTTGDAWPAPAGPAVIGFRVGATVARQEVGALGMPGADAAAASAEARHGPLSELELSWGLWVDVQGRRLGGQLTLDGTRERACEAVPSTQDSCLASRFAKLLTATITPN